MIRSRISGATAVAGVVGSPIAHSLSPLIHNAWLAEARHDGVYVPFAPDPSRFETFVEGLRGGALKGLNVTLPFKERALAVADRVDPAARAAGAANLLLFRDEGVIEARNTDGVGLMSALADQAPAWRPEVGTVVVLGAGGAARGAVAALVEACATVRVVNRNDERARDLCAAFPKATPLTMGDLELAMRDATAVINATPLDPATSATVVDGLSSLAPAGVVMDMVYTPLETDLLAGARRRGLTAVDGLAMLIGQARPSFKALFGVATPTSVDVRRLAEQMLRTPR